MGAVATICLGLAFSWAFFSVTGCFKRTLFSLSTSAFSAATFYRWHFHQWLRCSLHSLSDLLASPMTSSNFFCISSVRTFWHWSLTGLCLPPSILPKSPLMSPKHNTSQWVWLASRAIQGEGPPVKDGSLSIRPCMSLCGKGTYTGTPFPASKSG